MRLAILLPATLAAISSMLIASAAQTQICSCPGGGNVKDTIERADTVVIGEIQEQTSYGLLVRVERYFKNGGPSEIAVHDLTIESGCPSVSTAAKPGDRYQLYLGSDAELGLPYVPTTASATSSSNPASPTTTTY